MKAVAAATMVWYPPVIIKSYGYQITTAKYDDNLEMKV